MTTLYFLIIQIQFTMVILYIILVSEVSSIKKTVKKDSRAYWSNEYNKRIYFEEKKRALEALKELMWIDLRKAKNDGDEKEAQSVRERYEKMITDLGENITPVG